MEEKVREYHHGDDIMELPTYPGAKNPFVKEGGAMEAKYRKCRECPQPNCKGRKHNGGCICCTDGCPNCKAQAQRIEELEEADEIWREKCGRYYKDVMQCKAKFKATTAVVEKARALLVAGKCPACDGSGGIPVQIGEDEWEEEQCQWCDERKQWLAALDKGE